MHKLVTCRSQALLNHFFESIIDTYIFHTISSSVPSKAWVTFVFQPLTLGFSFKPANMYSSSSMRKETLTTRSKPKATLRCTWISEKCKKKNKHKTVLLRINETQKPPLLPWIRQHPSQVLIPTNKRSYQWRRPPTLSIAHISVNFYRKSKKVDINLVLHTWNMKLTEP